VEEVVSEVEEDAVEVVEHLLLVVVEEVLVGEDLLLTKSEL
jgi:hypothetical protein